MTPRPDWKTARKRAAGVMREAGRDAGRRGAGRQQPRTVQPVNVEPPTGYTGESRFVPLPRSTGRDSTEVPRQRGRKRTGGRAGAGTRPDDDQQLRGGLESWETNLSGNERHGEQFRRVTNQHGQEVHVYRDGRRVVDTSPGARTFQPVDDQRDAGEAYRVTQRTGRIEDTRRQASGLRGGAPPRRDQDGYAGRVADGAGDGTGNDAPLTRQARPLYTRDLRNPIAVASPYEADLLRHVRQRIARNQRRRGRRFG